MVLGQSSGWVELVETNPNSSVGIFLEISINFTSRLVDSTKWGPQTIAKLVNITPIKPMVYGRYNELVNGGYKPTNITGGHHLVGQSSGWVETNPNSSWYGNI